MNQNTQQNGGFYSDPMKEFTTLFDDDASLIPFSMDFDSMAQVSNLFADSTFDDLSQSATFAGLEMNTSFDLHGSKTRINSTPITSTSSFTQIDDSILADPVSTRPTPDTDIEMFDQSKIGHPEIDIVSYGRGK